MTKSNTLDKKPCYGSVAVDEVFTGEIIEIAPRAKSLLSYLEVKSDNPLESASFLLNTDLKPVPSKERCWRWYNYVCFWISDSLNVNAWQVASAGVAAGLNWWQAWLSVWVGYLCAAFFVVMVARPGTYYHIPFPVSVRSSFGMFGSIWPVLNRVMMAIVWFSCQTWIFGQSIQLMARCVWGNGVAERMPIIFHNDGVTQFEYLCYLAAWFLTLPFIWFPPSSVRHLFTLKSIVVPIAGAGFLIWTVFRAFTMTQGSHVLAENSNVLVASLQSSGSIKWKFIAATMNGICNFAGMIVNSPDFSRFADRPSAPTWSQFATIPFAFSITAIVGITVSTCAARIYNHIYWSPLDILDRFLDSEDAGTRTGVFFIAASLGLASIGTNICANSLSAGTDMSALLPRFINIRRGGYICATVAFFLKPWRFFASSNKFTSYLGSYSTFLSCVAGIMVSDYYIVRRGRLELVDLYTTKTHSTYMFGWSGINWRAYAAYLVGILPNLQGFLHVFGYSISPVGEYVYRFNYFVGFITSLAAYAVLSLVFPVDGGRTSGWHETYEFVDDFDIKMMEQRIR